MLMHSIHACFRPVPAEDIAWHVQESHPLFKIKAGYFILTRVWIDTVEHKNIGVMRTVAKHVKDASYLYPSQHIGIVCCEDSEELQTLLYGRKLQGLQTHEGDLL